MRALIVNADDFGLSPGVNQGILEAHERGPVTSTTVMANAPWAGEAAAAAEQFPGLAFGVHLTLTHGRPLLPDLLAPLLDEHGLLRRPRRRPGEPYARALARHFARVPRWAVVAEMRAQVEQALALGIPVAHLDTHHQLEIVPRLAWAVALVAARYGLPARCSRPGPRRVFCRLGVPIPDHFLAGFYGDGATMRWFHRRLFQPWEGTAEMNCHPAYADPALYERSSYTEGREWELAILVSGEPARLLAEAGVRLARFGDLG